MFSSLFLLTFLPTWVAAMVLMRLLHRRQQELESKKALAPQTLDR